MDPDAISLLLYLVASIISVVAFIAICQLFAIRRLLEVLVKQSSGNVAAAPHVTADLPSPPDAQPTPRGTGIMSTPAIPIAILVCIGAFILWLTLTGSSAYHH